MQPCAVGGLELRRIVVHCFGRAVIAILILAAQFLYLLVQKHRASCVQVTSEVYNLSEYAHEQNFAGRAEETVRAVLVPTVMLIVCAPTGSSSGRHQSQV